jgi:hypothetical protein
VGVDPAAVTSDQPPNLERVENARYVPGCADDETTFHQHVGHGLGDGANVVSANLRWSQALSKDGHLTLEETLRGASP